MRFYTNVTRWGNNLLLREYKDGQRIDRKVKYQPTLYSPVTKPTEYKTLEGEYVTPTKHLSMKDAKEWMSQYQPDMVYGNTMFAYSYLADEYVNNVEWDIDKILIVTIDIEVECENGFPNPEQANEPLLSITVKNHSNKQIMVWGLKDFTTDRDDITYLQCESEKHLIQEFLAFWESNRPDVITGWNTEFFDVPYICNRILNVMDEKNLKRLSPWSSVSSRDMYSQGRTHQLYDIQGVAHLDYYDLYRKFTYTSQESYRLDHIAYVELGERKDGNPYETFRDWYTKDYQSFIEYNITDVELVDKLEDKMKLIELCLTMAYDAKVNYMDVLGSVKYWDMIIYNHLRKKNIVIPQKKDNKKSEKFEGAYVKEPQLGEHKWVMSFDLNSLYPHLIMQYNISPETLKMKKSIWKKPRVEDLLNNKVDTSELKGRGVTVTPNGALFKTNKKGFLPEIMQTMYDDRVKYKQLMIQAKKEYERTQEPRLLKDIAKYNNIQMAKKISLNSAYGAIGNNWFRYYDLLVAEAITTSGQLSIRYIEHSLNRYINEIVGTVGRDYVLASDTDSVYITFDGLVSRVFKEKQDKGKIVDFLDRVAREKIEPYIDRSYTTLSEYVNAYEQKMQMKREVIADKGIWVAKKRYILNSWDVEGVRYKEPQLKLMGIEAVKSSTPAPCRKKLKDALKIIMSGDSEELNAFIQDFRQEFMTLPAEDIAYPRSVNGLKKFKGESSLFGKHAPIHCKGAILYNHLLRKEKLTHKYPFIQEGDKIKFVHMKIPNIYQSTSMSFMTQLPKEFGIQDKIDYDMQFEKSFVEALKFITDKIQWKLDKSYGTQGTLEGFFT